MGDDLDCEGSFLPRKPKTANFKDTSRRLRQGKENHLGHRASLDWRLDQERVCDQSYVATADIDLDVLKAVILKSRTGEALLQGDGVHPLEICYDPQTPLSQFYLRGEECIIALNPHRPKGDLLNTLVRELRRAWQHQRGALVNPMGFEPDEAVLVNRAQQADVLMMSVKVAWELKLVGEAEAWDYMGSSPLADVARLFEVHAQKDFRTLNNGEAARATYDKFFEGSRTKMHDKHIIHQMLLDDQGYMKSTPKQMRADMELFKKLGELPHGRNYLSGQGKRSPTDMCYSMIEDRSNANFLWFIKFERSFQEKELKMLQESVKISAQIVDFATWTAQPRHTPGRGI